MPISSNGPAEVAIRDGKGRLTYDGAVHVLRSGGSVMLDDGTRHVTRLEDLPSEVEFAQGDADREALALERLLAAQAAIQGQLERLGVKAKPAEPAKAGGRGK